MNVILFGPPGAGKGTQANKLVKKFKLHKISTGDLLRNEMKNQTTVGIKISSYMDKGLLVPDDIIENLITKILSNKIYFNISDESFYKLGADGITFTVVDITDFQD